MLSAKDSATLPRNPLKRDTATVNGACTNERRHNPSGASARCLTFVANSRHRAMCADMHAS